MKKFIVFTIIIIIVFFISIFIGKTLYINNSQTHLNIDNTICSNNEINNNKIIQKGELDSYGLREKKIILDNGAVSYDSSPEYRLINNDMIYDDSFGLYYKIITNTEDFNIYKERINIPEMTKSDFEKNFLVVITDERIRPENQSDLTISEIKIKENTTHIILKQKDNPSLNYYIENNVFWAVIDKSQLQENIKIEIE